MTKKKAASGIIVGPTDIGGREGVDAILPDGTPLKVGGGEVIMSEKASRDNIKELSRMNVEAGGVAFDEDVQKEANTTRAQGKMPKDEYYSAAAGKSIHSGMKTADIAKNKKFTKKARMIALHIRGLSRKDIKALVGANAGEVSNAIKAAGQESAPKKTEKPKSAPSRALYDEVKGAGAAAGTRATTFYDVMWEKPDGSKELVQYEYPLGSGQYQPARQKNMAVARWIVNNNRDRYKTGTVWAIRQDNPHAKMKLSGPSKTTAAAGTKAEDMEKVKVGDTVRISKKMPYMASIHQLVGKDLLVKNITTVNFASGPQQYLTVEADDGVTGETPYRFTENGFTDTAAAGHQADPILHSEPYDWGIFRTVEFGKDGIDGRATIHPDEWDRILNLRVENSLQYMDDQGIVWSVTREEGRKLYFEAQGGHGLKGRVSMEDTAAAGSITEADEGDTSKAEALRNFRFQVESGETMGIVQMYEDAARAKGATSSEINAARSSRGSAAKGGRVQSELAKEFRKKHNLSVSQFLGKEEITGYLDLSSLTSIPDGFNPNVSGSLDLRSLTSIPHGFSPNVGGNFYLGSLESSPEGFNPTVGGNIYFKKSSRGSAARGKAPDMQNNYYLKEGNVIKELKYGHHYRLKRCDKTHIHIVAASDLIASDKETSIDFPTLVSKMESKTIEIEGCPYENDRDKVLLANEISNIVAAEENKEMAVSRDSVLQDFEEAQCENVALKTEHAEHVSATADTIKGMEALAGGKGRQMYAGKTAEQVWDSWTPKQRAHFSTDHNLEDNVSSGILEMSAAQLKADKWGKEFGGRTSWDWVSGVLKDHIEEGSYAGGKGRQMYAGKTAKSKANKKKK